jgi:hypothetical protein
MTVALVDNATLTSVQRVIGKAQYKNRNSIDVDSVAFENFIQARLFYDEVVTIDDYIPKHRDDRGKTFPQVQFVSSAELEIPKIEQTANAIAAEIRPKIQGGEFANQEFRALFSLLQTHMVCTWDISSSIYHLNLKVLAEEGSDNYEKYGAVATAIFQELGEARSAGQWIQPDIELVDRFGTPIREGYEVPGARWGIGRTGPPTPAISAFIASLVWIANRAIFYTLAAAHLKADSFLYPIRQSYQQYFIAQRFQYHIGFTGRLVGQLSATLGADVAQLHTVGMPAFAALDIPVFSAWLARECGDPEAALFALEEIRNRTEFVEARGELNSLHEAFYEDGLEAGNRRLQRMLGSVQKISAIMRDKYAVQSIQGTPLTRLVSIYNAAAGFAGLPPLPTMELDLKIPHFLRDMKRRTGFCAVYRNVFNDLATVASLGEYHDVLTRRVVLAKDAGAYAPKSEKPQYRNSHSPFKSPM